MASRAIEEHDIMLESSCLLIIQVTTKAGSVMAEQAKSKPDSWGNLKLGGSRSVYKPK